MKRTTKILSLAIILLALHLCIPMARGQTVPETKIPPKCKKEADASSNFAPKAITLTSVNVRGQMPEYSITRGQYVMGQLLDTLPPDTCLAILEKQEIGVIQIWYLVKYKMDGKIKSGWVWGGTKDVDEDRYIGGDKTPERQKDKRSFLKNLSEIHSLILFANLAHAQTDPVGRNISDVQTSVGTVPRDEKPVEYYWKIPVLDWPMSVSAASAVFLFIAMLVGMFAKAVWDQPEGGKIIPPLVKIVRPFLISPIAFSAFWGPMYLQQGNAGISLTMALYAFQIGFMWQHVLEKKLKTGAD